MNEQIERISKTVSQFLEWASVENTQQKDNLFAIRMSKSIEDQIINPIKVFSPVLIWELKILISNNADSDIACTRK